jgi:hypothetical protein
VELKPEEVERPKPCQEEEEEEDKRKKTDFYIHCSNIKVSSVALRHVVFIRILLGQGYTNFPKPDATLKF